MKIIIDDFAEGQRIDVYISEYMHTFSRTKIQNSIKSGEILVNQKTVKPSYELKSGDVADINIHDNVLKIEPEHIKLDIIYEDDNMLAVNKPSGMLTHPTSIENSGTLVNALLYYCGSENLSDINGELRRGIIHRLDRNTSGLLMIAKNNDSHKFLADAIKNHKTDKRYLAIVKGNIEQDEFEINKPIGRNLNQPHKMAIVENGKESISSVKVLERLNGATLVEVKLITGRTHQIRVHMSSIGHPVYNDTLYGFGKMKINTQEQVLQSYKLSFPKPFDSEIVCCEIEPDDKIKKVLNVLRNDCAEKIEK